MKKTNGNLPLRQAAGAEKYLAVETMTRRSEKNFKINYFFYEIWRLLLRIWQYKIEKYE